MKRLITAAEVVAKAFAGGNNIRPEQISHATILAAERKYIEPVFGTDMYTAMLDGEYADFVENYLKEPLALYVKRLMLPQLALQVGTAGVVRYAVEGYVEADEAGFRRLLRRTKADADALVDRAVEQVENNPETYDLYEPALNVRHRVNIDSGVVIA